MKYLAKEQLILFILLQLEMKQTKIRRLRSWKFIQNWDDAIHITQMRKSMQAQVGDLDSIILCKSFFKISFF